ncbi:MAG: DinB family protein [Gemmatimonadaceae bacterium]|nr:DinB family protein [Gemmatimonadaceae bacterium]
MSGYGGKELAKAFRTVRNNTLQIAEDIPADQYDFVPAPGLRSVGALLTHIAMTAKLQEDFHRTRRLTTLQGYDFPAIIGALAAEEQKPRSKEDIIALLKGEGEQFASWLESLSPEFLDETYGDHTGANPRTRFEGLLSPKEHEMHHRAQLMLAQRLMGIVPHLTRAMQARMAARP